MNRIVSDIGDVVTAMRPATSAKYGAAFMTYLSAQGYTAADVPYYMYGHPVEIANRLKIMEKDSATKYTKYPLIVLRLDTQEKITDNIVEYTLNLAVMTLTDRGYNSEERYANIFVPILYPLYELFFEELSRSGYFMWTGAQNMPPHTKVDRMFWGTSTPNGNTANIFSDPLDAIEILDLKLRAEIRCD